MKKLESSFANMVIVLTIITVVAAACLGAMNNATAEPIAASKKAKQEAAIKAVLPEFASVDTAVILNEQKIFRAYDAENNLVGIAIETAELGFGGDITTMVGFDANGTIVNYSLLQHAETPGLGSKLVDWFLVKSDIRGANSANMPLRVSKDGGEYDANGAIVGIAIETAELGFGGDITTMVGFNANGVLVEYSLLQHAETPGLGSKLFDWFKVKSDIRGAGADKMPLRVSKDGGEFDAITAATISSRAFLNSINKAYETYQIALGETPAVDAWSGATTVNPTDTVATTDSIAVDAWSGATTQTDSLNSQPSTLN